MLEAARAQSKDFHVVTGGGKGGGSAFESPDLFADIVLMILDDSDSTDRAMSCPIRLANVPMMEDNERSPSLLVVARVVCASDVPTKRPRNLSAERSRLSGTVVFISVTACNHRPYNSRGGGLPSILDSRTLSSCDERSSGSLNRVAEQLRGADVEMSHPGTVPSPTAAHHMSDGHAWMAGPVRLHLTRDSNSHVRIIVLAVGPWPVSQRSRAEEPFFRVPMSRDRAGILSRQCAQVAASPIDVSACFFGSELHSPQCVMGGSPGGPSSTTELGTRPRGNVPRFS